jgi:serine/threonine-protein kinase RsbW
MPESIAVTQPDRAQPARRSWPAEPRYLSGIRSTVRQWLAFLDLAATTEDDLVLAVNEAASNAIEHAYSPTATDGIVEVAVC